MYAIRSYYAVTIGDYQASVRGTFTVVMDPAGNGVVSVEYTEGGRTATYTG